MNEQMSKWMNDKLDISVIVFVSSFGYFDKISHTSLRGRKSHRNINKVLVVDCNKNKQLCL